MADRHDAGGTVDGAAPEVVADAFDLAGVDPHAHAKADRRHPPLRRDRRLHRGLGRREGGGDAVAHRGEHLTADRVDRLAQDGEVPLDAAVHLRRLLPLPCRPLDVGEQEGHRRVGCTAAGDVVVRRPWWTVDGRSMGDRSWT